MISERLVRLIEANGEQLIDRTMAQVRLTPLKNSALLDNVLHDWCQDLLLNLGYWISAGHEYDITSRFDGLGKLCYEQAIPLHGMVRALTTLRDKMMDFAQENLMSNSSVELYAQEELDRRLGRFFGHLLVHLTRGYEEAVEQAAESRRPVTHSRG